MDSYFVVDTERNIVDFLSRSEIEALLRTRELDLLVVRGNRRIGFEFKRTSAPARTPSMTRAIEALRLERIDVIHPGAETFPMGPRIRALPVEAVGWDA
jgi:predicted AAA+ superfamily ATPase